LLALDGALDSVGVIDRGHCDDTFMDILADRLRIEDCVDYQVNAKNIKPGDVRYVSLRDLIGVDDHENYCNSWPLYSHPRNMFMEITALKISPRKFTYCITGYHNETLTFCSSFKWAKESSSYSKANHVSHHSTSCTVERKNHGQ